MYAPGRRPVAPLARIVPLAPAAIVNPVRHVDPASSASAAVTVARAALLLFGCLLLWAVPDTARAALAAADHSSGYSGIVLAQIAPLWQPPADSTPRTAHVRVHIDAQGRVNSCAPTVPSGNPALDASVCAAVRAAGKFASPPYSLPIDIFLHFWTGQPNVQTGQTSQHTGAAQAAATQSAAPLPVKSPAAQPSAGKTDKTGKAARASAAPEAQEQEKAYVNKAMESIRANIVLPQDLSSGQSCTVRVLVDKTGRVLSARLEKAARPTSFDKAILQAVNKTARLEPTPDGSNQELALTFVLEMP